MSAVDDVPWPELGNVSRGATRGNQGQKGVLGPPDSEGRAVIQLRVQPGVLQVRLNRQATQWYRILYSEVDNALKLTKTFWRKARRRQDYDAHARADQDHMELSEWLQQLKDKTMSHLELLMQKGEITGPPYVMRDDLELTFLRKFIERHNAGIPHHPRLRNAASSRNLLLRAPSVESSATDTQDDYYHRAPEFLDHRSLSVRDCNDGIDRTAHSSSRTSISSPSIHNLDVNGHPISSSKYFSAVRSPPNDTKHHTPGQSVQCAQTALVLARKQTQEAFMRYTSCLDSERQAQQHFDEVKADSRRSSTSMEDPTLQPSEYDCKPDFSRSPDPGRSSRLSIPKAQDWVPANDSQGVYLTEPTSQFDNSINHSRKHPRTWYQGDIPDEQYSYGDMNEPPKKRIQRMVPGFETHPAMSLHSHSMTMSS